MQVAESVQAPPPSARPVLQDTSWWHLPTVVSWSVRLNCTLMPHHRPVLVVNLHVLPARGIRTTALPVSLASHSTATPASTHVPQPITRKLESVRTALLDASRAFHLDSAQVVSVATTATRVCASIHVHRLTLSSSITRVLAARHPAVSSVLQLTCVPAACLPNCSSMRHVLTNVPRPTSLTLHTAY